MKKSWSREGTVKDIFNYAFGERLMWLELLISESEESLLMVASIGVYLHVYKKAVVNNTLFLWKKMQKICEGGIAAWKFLFK